MSKNNDQRPPNGDRLIALESVLAEQEKTIQDLSDMVADQWHEIDRLKVKLGQVTDRLKQAEARLPAETGNDDQPPPHY